MKTVFFKPEQMTTQAAFDGLPARRDFDKPFWYVYLHYGYWCNMVVVLSPVNGYRRDVLLGSTDMKAHQQQTAYFGATVGRFANRIAGAKFTIVGTEYRLVTMKATIRYMVVNKILAIVAGLLWRNPHSRSL